MKPILTLSLLLLTLSSFAQPVITSAYNPIFGDTYVYKIVDDTATAQPGQAGAGVIWNLASMHGLLTTRQYNWVQTATTNDAATFSATSNIAAQIIENGFSPKYEFYNVGSSFNGDMKKVGTHIDWALNNYYGGYMYMDYPFQFGQTCTDTMLGTTGVAYVNGRCTTTYDGHGTLQLEAQSGGNFSNVARVKVEENYIVNYGPIETHHVETYYWFDHSTVNLTKQPIAIIMTHEWIDLGGLFQREKFALMRQVLFINGTPQLNLNNANVSVYPSPFENKIHVSLPAVNTEVSIGISDLTGRMIRTIYLEKSLAARDEVIALYDLKDGVYFVKISSDKGSVVKRIVKD